MGPPIVIRLTKSLVTEIWEIDGGKKKWDKIELPYSLREEFVFDALQITR